MQHEKVYFKNLSRLGNMHQFLELMSDIIYEFLQSSEDGTHGNLDGIMHMIVDKEQLKLNYVGWYFAEPYVKVPVTKNVLVLIREDLDYINLELQKSKVNSPKTHNDLLQLVFAKLDKIKVDIEKAHWLFQLSHPIKFEIAGFENDLRDVYDYNPSDNLSGIKNLPKPLIWNGGVATLGTLFYELYFEQRTKNGDYFIEGSQTEITNLVHEMFVQPDGQKFEITSLRTYISSSSSKAKAKSNKVQIEMLEKKAEDKDNL